MPILNIFNFRYIYSYSMLRDNVTQKYDLIFANTTKNNLIAALITAGKYVSRWSAVSYRRQAGLGSPGIDRLPPAS
jgi:hypothetical protein